MMKKMKKEEDERMPDRESIPSSFMSSMSSFLRFSSLLLEPESAVGQPSEDLAQLERISHKEDRSRRLQMVTEHYVGKYVLPHLASMSQRTVLAELLDIPKPLQTVKVAVNGSGPAVHQTLRKLIEKGFAEKVPEGYVCTRIGKIVSTAYSTLAENHLKPFRRESGSEKRYDLLVRMYLSQSLGADGVRLTSLARQLSYSTGYLSDMLRSLVDARLLDSRDAWGRPYSLSETGVSLVRMAQELTSEIVMTIREGITASPPDEYELTPEGFIRPVRRGVTYHRIHSDGRSVRFTRF